MNDTRTELAHTALTFAKAILKSGYYTADHEQSARAAQEFVASLGKLGEVFEFIEFRWAERQAQGKLLVVSDLVEPISLEKLIGGSSGQMFQDKLANTFTNRKLISVVLRGLINATQAGAFFRVIDQLPGLSEENAKQQLIDSGVLAASLLLEQPEKALIRQLSWNVEVALRRLQKDVGSLPLYQGVSAEQLARIRRQVAAETLHGIRRPDLLAELIYNIDLVLEYASIDSADWLLDAILNDVAAEYFGEILEALIIYAEKAQKSEEALFREAASNALAYIFGHLTPAHAKAATTEIGKLLDLNVVQRHWLNTQHGKH